MKTFLAVILASVMVAGAVAPSFAETSTQCDRSQSVCIPQSLSQTTPDPED